MWEMAGNYTGTMIGYHAASLIADSYVKGYRNFDVQEAYKACLRTAEYDTTGIITHPLVVPHLMPQAKYSDRNKLYIPRQKPHTYRGWLRRPKHLPVRSYTSHRKHIPKL